MKSFSLVLFLIINVVNSLLAQPEYAKIRDAFYNADSVIIVSHVTTYQPNTTSSGAKKLKPLVLVSNNKVNYKIIKEQYLLDKIETDSIAKILTEKNTDSIIKNISCFIPHHGILIFTKGKCSFFDICFGCRHFVSSKNLNLSDDLSDRTWERLELFFRHRGLNYKMSIPEKEL